jgi:uncharacterized protein YjbJ (UPF0337 family)
MTGTANREWGRSTEDNETKVEGKSEVGRIKGGNMTDNEMGKTKFSKNKAVNTKRPVRHGDVVKMDESGITDLMLLIEAEYERKYGENVAKKYKKTVL